MDGEEAKHVINNDRKVVPVTQPSQIDSDLTFAMTIQEQERQFLVSIMEESENYEFSDEDEDDDDDAEADPGYGLVDEEFLEEGEGEEEEGSSEDEDMEQDEIDPDEMSYEELLELGETVGSVNKGLSANELANSLRPYENKFKLKREDVVDRCVICQDEYKDGESLVMLSCEQPYHSDCISKWLQIKKVCPICSNEVSSSSK
ncbi:E3 ubiquitin ligase BIG BROTHER-related-like isoform X2 [Macadamia integrifolia]|uniref:E3 ubiquitin ligase BIG BROTHER-related-like isoform X2 n=1 Tax=Macadamia integrifolia TaxID=60698 RepID=UPI001C4ED63A|nr:E3 ubiquitin ligase BIG BROTHER-related-like isoform X2 [Macadamia integrifolia]